MFGGHCWSICAHAPAPKYPDCWALGPPLIILSVNIRGQYYWLNSTHTHDLIEQKCCQVNICYKIFVSRSKLFAIKHIFICHFKEFMNTKNMFMWPFATSIKPKSTCIPSKYASLEHHQKHHQKQTLLLF